MTDYVLTVAVSVSAGVDNIASAVPRLHAHQLALALGFVAVLALGNLRGMRESGRAFAVPTYCFVAGVLVMVLWGLLRAAFGSAPQAESAGLPVHPEQSYAGLAVVFLALRAFSSGCTALTGVEAIANGVPAFRPPKSANAARTLLVLGALAIAMFGGITALALLGHVHVAEDPRDLGLPAGEETKTVIAQVAAAVFGGDRSIGFIWITLFTALVLVLAANTAFNGFPVLASILAQDRYAPRQLHTRGDRLVYSNGIVLLAVFAGLLIWAFDASTTRLIQLYIIGVFLSFTLSQAGMVQHWTRLLAVQREPGRRRSQRRRRAVNRFGAAFTGVVLVVVLATKFLAGAWIVVIAMPLIYLLMTGIHRHYDRVGQELEWRDGAMMLPPRNHAVVLVSRLHLPTARALGVRPGDPARHAHRAHRQRRRRRHAAVAGGVGAARRARPAHRRRVAVPGDHPPGAAVCAGAAPVRPARRRHRLHPGVRGRALVGAAAAQPKRAAAEGPAALPAGSDGHQRALAARLGRAPGAATRVRGGGGRGRCAAASGHRRRLTLAESPVRSTPAIAAFREDRCPAPRGNPEAKCCPGRPCGRTRGAARQSRSGVGGHLGAAMPGRG